jgi:hypothetical protein
MASVNDPIYAVMVPVQEDGGGEWINPVIPVWFQEELHAREWAKNWAATHTGFATVYRCEPVVDIRLEHPARFGEDTYPKV